PRRSRGSTRSDRDAGAPRSVAVAGCRCLLLSKVDGRGSARCARYGHASLATDGAAAAARGWLARCVAPESARCQRLWSLARRACGGRRAGRGVDSSGWWPDPTAVVNAGMSIVSLQFAAFVSLVLVVYHWLPQRAQQPWLLLASYVFYGIESWRFL